MVRLGEGQRVRDLGNNRLQKVKSIFLMHRVLLIHCHKPRVKCICNEMNNKIKVSICEKSLHNKEGKFNAFDVSKQMPRD